MHPHHVAALDAVLNPRKRFLKFHIRAVNGEAVNGEVVLSMKYRGAIAVWRGSLMAALLLDELPWFSEEEYRAYGLEELFETAEPTAILAYTVEPKPPTVGDRVAKVWKDFDRFLLTEEEAVGEVVEMVAAGLDVSGELGLASWHQVEDIAWREDDPGTYSAARLVNSSGQAYVLTRPEGGVVYFTGPCYPLPCGPDHECPRELVSFRWDDPAGTLEAKDRLSAFLGTDVLEAFLTADKFLASLR